MKPITPHNTCSLISAGMKELKDVYPPFTINLYHYNHLFFSLCQEVLSLAMEEYKDIFLFSFFSSWKDRFKAFCAACWGRLVSFVFILRRISLLSMWWLGTGTTHRTSTTWPTSWSSTVWPLITRWVLTLKCYLQKCPEAAFYFTSDLPIGSINLYGADCQI